MEQLKLQQHLGTGTPDAISEHPCYSQEAHHQYGRIHVPVAPKCNIQCNYCTRKFACPNENRPGVSTKVVSPTEALQTIGAALEKEPRLRVLGVAGPGDALANEATLETFKRAKETYPTLSRCISTNGLMLLDKLDDMVEADITSLTITINAVDADIGEQIYSHVRYKGTTYRDREAFTVLNRNQLEGLRQAAMRGMFVKVNSVLIPGVNDRHMVEVARTVKGLGAYTMNIIPMIPLAKFAHMSEPTDAEVNQVRDECEAVIQQFRNCMRCRADAIGIPGEEGCGGDALASDSSETLASKTCTPKFLKDKAVMRLEGNDGKPALA
jgi:nitrogen fixation protein NifB